MEVVMLSTKGEQEEIDKKIETVSKELIFLKPVLKENIWGGSRLKNEFLYDTDSDSIGECWGISAHPNGDCEILQGKYQGLTLSILYKEHPELFHNLPYEEFPLLVKIIDANQDLSIQVHPDDRYACEKEHTLYGKTECWYIMDCPEDATLVIGHNATTREELKAMIAENRYEELIREIPVQKGDMIQIDPGTIHAIKSGFLILETQQNSDITYRVYDYNRLSEGKPRPLHVEQSIEVTKVPDKLANGTIKKAEDLPENEFHLLAVSDYYKVWKLNVKEGFDFEQDHPFLIISVLEGNGTIDGNPIQKGTHLLIPYGYGAVNLSGKMEIIASTSVSK